MLAAEQGLPIRPNLVEQLLTAGVVVAHELCDEPIAAQLERPVGLECLVDSPRDHLELDVAHARRCDGGHVVVDVGVVGVVGVAVPVLEEELHRIDLEELVHIEHLVRAGQPVRLDVTASRISDRPCPRIWTATPPR